MNPWKGYKIWEKKPDAGFWGMWVSWNFKDASEEQGKYGGLIQSSSVKDRETLEDRPCVQCVINFSSFSFLLSYHKTAIV